MMGIEDESANVVSEKGWEISCFGVVQNVSSSLNCGGGGGCGCALPEVINLDLDLEDM